MKYFILPLTIIFFSFSSIKEYPSDFDYKLSNIVLAFKKGILDSKECEKQKREVQILINDIEEAISEREKYSLDEIKSFKNIKKEALAIEDYISSVGHCGSYSSSIERFYTANRRVGGNVNNVITGKFCLDIISVTIGEYIAYLVINDSTTDYKVEYKWKGNNGMNTGNGNFGISSKDVRSIYNNRDNIKLKKISVYTLICDAF